jgi:hypothetical protein
MPRNRLADPATGVGALFARRGDAPTRPPDLDRTES